MAGWALGALGGGGGAAGKPESQCGVDRVDDVT